MPIAETSLEQGGLEGAPWWRGDNGSTRLTSWGKPGERVDLHGTAASPEGVVTTLADAAQSICWSANGTRWTFSGTPGTAVGWVQDTGGGGGGSSTFLGLTDTPAAYTAVAGYLLRVNAGMTAVEFVNGGSLFDAAGSATAAQSAAIASAAATTEAAVTAHDADAAAHPGLARWRDTTVAVHWALDTGNDANDGSAGNPVQTAARAKALADGLLRFGVNVVVTLDEVAAGGAKYVLWDAVVLGESDCRLEFVAAASTYVTVASGYSVASRVQYHISTRITVTGTPWTENQHRTRWIRPSSGALSGNLIKVVSNATGTVDIGGLLVPAVAVTFDIVEPGVLVEGPGTAGHWQPYAPALNPAFAVSHPRLRCHGLVFSSTVSLSGGVAMPFCRLTTGNINVLPGSGVTFYDHATGLYTGVDLAAGRILVETGAQCWYGHVTAKNPPSVQAGAAFYMDSYSYAGATTLGNIYGECWLGALYGRGTGMIKVELGGKFLFDSSSGRRSLLDVQTTGAIALYVTRGGFAQLTQTGSTATSFPTLLQLTSGTSIQVDEGGQLIVDPGRFCQGLGRGAGALDILVGAIHTVDAGVLYDGVNVTRRVHVKAASDGGIFSRGSETNDHQLRDETVALQAEAAPTSAMLLRIVDATTSLVRKLTVAALNAVLDHGTLAGLGDDDHILYPLVSGLRGFTGAVGGVAPTAGAHLATKAYVDSLVQGVEWHKSVADRDLTTPPVSPTTGDRYIVATGGTGDWAGHNLDIAEWSGTAWVFTDPTLGSTVAVDDEQRSVRWDGDSWEFLESFLSHQAMVGAGVKTHAELDAEYALTVAHRANTSNPHGVTAAQAGADPAGTATSAVSTHNADAAAHAGHALLAGRAGGQALKGGTASGEHLTLESTAHGTKGDVRLASGTDLDAQSNAMLQVQRIRTKITALTSAAGALAVDIGAGGDFRMPLTESLTGVTFSGASGDPQKGLITFLQHASTGPYTVTGWAISGGGSIRWVNNSGAPTMPTGASKIMLVSYHWNGTELLLGVGLEA